MLERAWERTLFFDDLQHEFVGVFVKSNRVVLCDSYFKYSEM